ncbi:MAG: hypothetical protein VBE63_27405, partial [Lamprobacter sp.]|uniref:hypothetical protein n=1 Tax=Lamprobacter sp. TaxID=3100796 RepID=UPI002B260B14
IHHLDTPFNNPSADVLADIEVTDPTHPLFGRRFALLRRLAPIGGQTSVLVVYQEGVFLRLPLVATDLVLSERRPPAKLTVSAVTELVTLAQRFGVCPSLPTPSGTASVPSANSTSSPT